MASAPRSRRRASRTRRRHGAAPELTWRRNPHDVTVRNLLQRWLLDHVARRLYPHSSRLTPVHRRATFRATGATGFDGVGETVAACPGTRVLVNPSGKSQLPTPTWLWLRNFGSRTCP